LCNLHAQTEDTLTLSEKYQQHLNEEFSDKKTSPLTEEDLTSFNGLDFFKINEEFIIQAKFKKTPHQLPFEMPTSTERKPIYVKFGEVHFKLNNKEFKLNVYQNQRLVTDPKYKDYLFIPFTDLTNGETTYGSGRYLDFSIPKSDKVELDFNKAYNPYCAYNGKYSCPIPPEENHLSIFVEAGVKKFNKK
jgi:uncharacterized protein (DUF1684 family)